MLETFYRVRKIYFLIMAVIGVPVNLVAIVILSRGKCGLSSCTTRYLVAMATADLLTIIFQVILWRISYYYFPGSFLEMTPVCSSISVPARAATDCSVWFTVTFTFDRFVAICCQKLKAKFCTGKTAAVVLTTTGVLFCFKNVPYFFMYRPLKVIDNIRWDCIQAGAVSVFNLDTSENEAAARVVESPSETQIRNRLFGNCSRRLPPPTGH
ncbi:probable G-protein coupled receptor 139 [Hypanus sabinus]|uniref:probable G-protein coupled receptor 139 n=1 Tax=Hypanus sabinus TaxID=79690 RepID=UPI0028C4FE58|nr:probable G-protein coupled receptor 139 [Hypanus sabinus]